ncbi:MAG: hypothetical protein MJ211_13835 [Bacteroidales bacterium]|nr:hypothetical protein [Bacteroidales bacterium]
MKKLFFLIALLFTTFNIANAQWFVGGSASISTQNSNVQANIMPEFGRNFLNNDLSLAIAPFMSYYKIKNYDTQYTYGARVYATYTIFNGIYATAGLQAQNYEKYEGKRVWQIECPIGAGYRYCVGSLSLYAEITYDILHDENSYGENPMVRAGAFYNF